MPSNFLSIVLAQYQSGGSPVGPQDWWQSTSQTASAFVDAASALAAEFVAEHSKDAGEFICMTLRTWMSGGVAQSPVVVRQTSGESDSDFIDRAKRTFRSALDAHPPD